MDSGRGLQVRRSERQPSCLQGEQQNNLSVREAAEMEASSLIKKLSALFESSSSLGRALHGPGRQLPHPPQPCLLEACQLMPRAVHVRANRDEHISHYQEMYARGEEEGAPGETARCSVRLGAPYLLGSGPPWGCWETVRRATSFELGWSWLSLGLQPRRWDPQGPAHKWAKWWSD